jgi:polyhydroxyalkanoate synthesis regulator phasin
MIDSTTGQLGTVSSSRRFKENIHDMGDASEGLMRLRPVTFRYKQPFDDGSKPIQYGLIAEEVAEVYPDLVARSADGQIETVKYQLLDPMLLNEVQRQHAETQLQQAKIRDQQAQIRNLIKTQKTHELEQQNQIKAQQAQIRELASQVRMIQASLRTRRGSGHSRLASAKSTPAPATTGEGLALASATRGGN